MKLNRLFFLLLALSSALTARADLSALFTNAAPARSALVRRPSIIFIQCRGIARGDLSCYGQTNFQTPNLDRLAADGIRFTHYTGGADSAATTAHLLAGKNSAPAAGEPGLAQRLRQNGYHTGLIGAWELGDENSGGAPWKTGFDEFAGYFDKADAQNFYADYIWRYVPKFLDTNNQVATFAGKEELYPNTGGQKGQYIPDLFTKAALLFVKNNLPDKFNRYRPFFLLVNYQIPNGKIEVPTDAPFTGEKWPQAAKNRAALITRLDGGIGRLFEQLNTLKLTNTVAVFFTGSSAPEKFADTNLNFLLPAGDFRAATNSAPAPLPMIANWPGTIPAGRVSDREWTAADFAPTALEMAYAKPATNFTGHSVLPALLGRKTENTAP